MRLHRFCCPGAVREDGRVRIDGAAAAQMRRVLRLGPGDRVIVFGADEWEYTVQLERWEPDGALATVVERAAPRAEPQCHLTLAMALLKSEKTEWVLQKGTELGVARFVLMQTRRTVAAPDERRVAGRWERYSRIVREATEQCGRVRTPCVDGVLPFERALSEVGRDTAFILHGAASERFGVRYPVLGVQSSKVEDGPALVGPNTEYPTPNTQHPTSERMNSRVVLFVGPEGGFTEEEVALALARGAVAASLGPRVLRAETAALAAVTLAVDALEG